MNRIELGKLYDRLQECKMDIRHDCNGRDLKIGDIVIDKDKKKFRCVEFNPTRYYGLGLKTLYGKKVMFYPRCLIEIHELRKFI